MSAPTADAASEPIEGANDFSQRVRLGTNVYVLQGIGLPARRLPLPRRQAGAVRRSAGCSSAASRRGSAARRTSGSWIVRGHRLPEGVPLGVPGRGAGLRLHERTARLPHLAAVHRLPALPASGHDQAGAVPEPAAVRRHDAHLARRRALRGASSLSLLRALVQPEIGRRSSCRSSSCCRSAALGDKTIFLAARVEHHFAMIVCFLFAGNWIAACKGCSSRSGSGPASRSSPSPSATSSRS